MQQRLPSLSLIFALSFTTKQAVSTGQKPEPDPQVKLQSVRREPDRERRM